MKYVYLVILTFILTGCSNKSLYQKFYDIGKQNGVNHRTLMAICKGESNLKPYVINVNKSILNIQKGPHFFTTWIGANSYMDLILDPLLLNYDIGICQINKQHLKRFKLDNEDLLEDEENIRVRSKIYLYNVKKCKGNIYCRLSMYNTGFSHTKSKIGHRYRKKILKIRKEMFGK